MNGIVNKALRDTVLTHFGPAVWSEVVERTQLTESSFVALEYYPDEITYRLAGGAAEVSGTPLPEFLEMFGRHFLDFVRSRESYGAILDSCGNSFEEVIGQLDNLHFRISMVMPKLKPPGFHVVKTGPNQYLLEYRSHRPGLEPLLIGLIRGLAARFEQHAEVTHLAERSNGSGSSWFAIQIR